MPFDSRDYEQANRYEHVLQEAGVGLAAASRHARRTVPAASAHERAIRDVAAGVAAPLLVSYVVWILQDARARGIERLYFLSRDAEVLLELAGILAPRLGIEIELRYLYASRKAWLGASKNAWPWDNSSAHLTVADVLDQLSIDRDANAADLARLGFDRPEAILDKAGRLRLRTYLLTSDLLVSDRSAGAEKRRLLHDYLDQEKMFDGVPKAVVDLGGHGTQHDPLCKLLERNGRSPCPLYLFWGEPFDGWSWMHLRRCFHFDGSDKKAGARSMSFVMMEAFCSAEHGTLTGFHRAGDRVEPILAEARTEVLRDWGLPLVRDTLATFARAFDPAGAEPRDFSCIANPVLRDTLTRLADTFWHSPTAGEARAWCRFPWDLGGGQDTVLGATYTFGDIPAVLRTRGLRKYPSFWVPGALALTPYPVLAVLHGLRGAVHAGRRGRQKVGGIIGRLVGQASTARARP
jgi:hypothetical protein